MTAAPPTVGRRERDAQEKLERMTRAARELFSQRGVAVRSDGSKKTA